MSTPSESQSQTPLLLRTRHLTRRPPSLRNAARFLRRASSRRLPDPSARVRESAAEQIESRQSDWAYSRPVVALDLVWNLTFIATAVAVLVISWGEKPEVPLRVWVCGYGLQCLVHMVCVGMEFRKRRSEGLERGEGSGRWWGSRNESSESDGVESGERPNSGDDDASMAKHLESANTMFSFIWWIIGFYWVSAGGETLTNAAPQLYWLCIIFLAFDVFFVVICVAVACLIGIAVCCCLPCIIAILYAVADQEGATKEDIERLTKYKFRKIGEFEKQNGEIQESFGGIMTECDTDSPTEHVLSLEDAECCICLCSYDDGVELRELPCCHHFHSSCIDKWLYINATCPLCKFNILKNGNQSGSEEV